MRQPLGTYGNFSIASNGQWTYTLNNAAGNVQALKAGQVVTDTFTVNTVGGITRAFGITINGSNDAPVLTTTKAILANGSEDTPYTITQGSLLTGFSDVDGNALSVSGLSATNGTLSAFNSITQSWTFTPAANFNGTVNLSYNVTDGVANTIVTQSFRLVAVNDAPTGVPTIIGTLTQGQTLVANTASIADADGLGVFAYQWQTSVDGITWNTISGATSGNYMLSSMDVGKTIRVKISYSDIAGNIEYIQSSPTTAIIASPIIGTTGNDYLTGTTGADTMIGSLGNDTYVVNHSSEVVTENLNEGVDSVQASVSYTLSPNVENLTLTGTAAINGTGNGLNNSITGNTAANRLTGGAGNDVLNGGTGVDTMIGGIGNDTYTVDVLTDIITEHANEGTDLVNVAIATSGGTYTLGSNVENGKLTNVVAFTLNGNSVNNTLTGNGAANTLNGSFGADTMIGGAGNDIYVVDNIGDLVVENSTVITEIDRVQSSISFTLGANLENLTLTGTAAINGSGNTLNNTIIGNVGNNTLDGGVGTDTLIGGTGNDIYLVDLTSTNTLQDTITETTLGGVDTLRLRGGTALTTFTTLTLGTEIDNIDASATGMTLLNLSGNALSNFLNGNAAANKLTGGAGNDLLNGLGGSDTMVGGIGNDTYTMDVLTDIITENLNEGTDLVNVAIATSGGTYTLGTNLENATLTNTVIYNLTGNTLNNVLTGNAFDNLLNGGAGTDTMIGRAGNDTYLVDNLSDIVTENANEGTDVANIAITTAGGTYTLSANVENGNLTNTVAFTLVGNTLNNRLTGNAAANTLVGSAGNDELNGLGGNDTMIGGIGNDTYTMDVLTDIITENLNEGTDLVNVAIATSGGTYTLGANLENATLTNAVVYNLTGSAENNVLTGNNAMNTLIGNAGNDTLNGNLGNDILTGGLGNDLFKFTSVLSNTNVDTISDFLRGTDDIGLATTIFTKLLNDTDLSDNIVVRSSGTNALDANDYLIFNSTTKVLYYDADGSGLGAAVQFAILTNTATVNASDFVVI